MTTSPGLEKRGLAVDLLAQYKALLDQVRAFAEILGNFNDAAKVESEA